MLQKNVLFPRQSLTALRLSSELCRVSIPESKPSTKIARTYG